MSCFQRLLGSTGAPHKRFLLISRQTRTRPFQFGGTLLWNETCHNPACYKVKAAVNCCQAADCTPHASQGHVDRNWLQTWRKIKTQSMFTFMWNWAHHLRTSTTSLLALSKSSNGVDMQTADRTQRLHAVIKIQIHILSKFGPFHKHTCSSSNEHFY